MYKRLVICVMRKKMKGYFRFVQHLEQQTRTFWAESCILIIIH